MPKVATQQAGRTSERILEHARELVQLRGYNGFSYGDLAARLGIKTASIHYHFPSKSDLGLALIERYRQDFSVMLEEIDAKASGSIDRLRRYIAIFTRTFEGDHRMCLCGSLSLDVLTLTDPVRSEVRRYLDDNVQWLMGVLEDGQRSGEVCGEIDPKQAAEAFLATLEGAMLTARPFADAARLEAAGEWMIRSVRA